MPRNVTESRHRLALAGDRPNVNGGYLIRVAAKQSDFRMSQTHLIKDEGVMTPAVEIKKRHGAKQFVLSAECQNAFWIEFEISLKVRLGNLNSGDQSVGHVSEGRKLGMPRGLHIDFCTSGQHVKIVPCGKGDPFHNRVAHLSSLLPVSEYHTGWGFWVCSNYCIGVLRLRSTGLTRFWMSHGTI